MKEELENIRKNHLNYRERDRATGILLYYRGYNPKEIANIFEVTERVIYNWLRNFKEYGIEGIMTKEGQGRKAILEKKI